MLYSTVHVHISFFYKIFRIKIIDLTVEFTDIRI